MNMLQVTAGCTSVILNINWLFQGIVLFCKENRWRLVSYADSSAILWNWEVKYWFFEKHMCKWIQCIVCRCNSTDVGFYNVRKFFINRLKLYMLVILWVSTSVQLHVTVFSQCKCNTNSAEVLNERSSLMDKVLVGFVVV